MVTGANRPGTAQLDATARSSSTSASASQTANSPLTASTAVQVYRSGHDAPFRYRNDATNGSSGNASADSANRPIAALRTSAGPLIAIAWAIAANSSVICCPLGPPALLP